MASAPSHWKAEPIGVYPNGDYEGFTPHLTIWCWDRAALMSNASLTPLNLSAAALNVLQTRNAAAVSALKSATMPSARSPS